MAKTLKNFLSYALFFLFIIIALIYSVNRNFVPSFWEGLRLWIFFVLPALFPYFFITAILSSLSVTQKLSLKLSPFTKRFFNVNGTIGYAYFMSLISGYPVGAKLIFDLKENGLISDTESVRGAAICSTTSVSFTVSVIGNAMFKNTLFGIFVFLSAVISSFFVGLVFSFYKRNEKPLEKIYTSKENTTDNVLYNSAYSSVISILIVGALITVFYIFTDMLLKLNVLSPVINFLSLFLGEDISESITLGFFESTRALQSLSSLPLSFLSLPITSAICGFGGLSVILQSLSYLKRAKIKTAPFLFSKILSAVFNFLISLIFSLFL